MLPPYVQLALTARHGMDGIWAGDYFPYYCNARSYSVFRTGPGGDHTGRDSDRRHILCIQRMTGMPSFCCWPSSVFERKVFVRLPLCM